MPCKVGGKRVDNQPAASEPTIRLRHFDEWNRTFLNSGLKEMYADEMFMDRIALRWGDEPSFFWWWNEPINALDVNARKPCLDLMWRRAKNFGILITRFGTHIMFTNNEVLRKGNHDMHVLVPQEGCASFVTYKMPHQLVFFQICVGCRWSRGLGG